MVIPEADEAAEQIGASQERAVCGCCGTEDEVVSATGAGMPTVLLELFGAQSAMTGIVIDTFGDLTQLCPAVSGLDIDFDDAGIGGDFEQLEPWVVWRQVAFDDDWQLQFLCRSFNAGKQIEVVFERADGRHEHMQFAIAGFNAQCSPHDSAARRRIEPLVRGFFRVIDESKSLEYLALRWSGPAMFAVTAILSGPSQFAVAGQWWSICEGVSHRVDGSGGQRQ